MMLLRMFSTGRLISSCLLASSLLPIGAFAQAGLTGNALYGQAEEMRSKTPFTQGFKSKSALGQLEELTGSKVDRSAPARAPAPRAAPKVSRSVQMRNQFNQEVAGMLADALVQMIFSDNSAQQKAAAEAAAAEAAAQAAAQAEAFRVQQELARLARIHQAQVYRAEWDARETEIGDRLGDAFLVGTGTGYFGQPAGPEAAGAALLSQVGGDTSVGSDATPTLSDWDPSVVDLRESSLVVQPFAQPTRGVMPGTVSPINRATTQLPRSAHDWPVTETPPPPRPPTSGLLPYMGTWLGDLYWGLAEGAAKATLWGTLKNVRGQAYVKAIADFDANRSAMTEEMAKSNEALMDAGLYRAADLVHSLGSPNRSGAELIDPYFNNLNRSARKVVVDMAKLIYGRVTEQLGELDLGQTGLSPLESGG